MVVSRVIVFSDGWRRSVAAQTLVDLDQEGAGQAEHGRGVGALEDGRGPLGATTSDCSCG